jgi:hypothetical protein
LGIGGFLTPQRSSPSCIKPVYSEFNTDRWKRQGKAMSGGINEGSYAASYQSVQEAAERIKGKAKVT